MWSKDPCLSKKHDGRDQVRTTDLQIESPRSRIGLLFTRDRFGICRAAVFSAGPERIQVDPKLGLHKSRSGCGPVWVRSRDRYQNGPM